MNYINDKMFTTQRNKTSEYHRQFMLSEWKDIISMNIKKFSKEYPELKKIDIDDCSEQIEEIIYNKCVYKNDSNLPFYFFCQVYIYIYLTDIFKDIFIEKFIIHIYNCYVNNDIKDIVHCHDYILKNIVDYDCSIESELIKYINLINQNVKKLSEIMLNKYKNRIKKYSEEQQTTSKKIYKETSNKYNKQTKNNEKEKGIFDNIIDSVKNIFTTSDNSSKPSHKINNEKKFETTFIPFVPQSKDKQQQPIIINSSVNCVDKKYLDEMEERLTKLIKNTQNNNIENLNKLFKQFESFSSNIIKIVNDIKSNKSTDENFKYVNNEINKIKLYFEEYNKNIINTINSLNKNIEDKISGTKLLNENNNKIIIQSLNEIRNNNKNIYDMLLKYQTDLQNKKLIQPIIKLPENIQNLSDENFKKILIEYNKEIYNKLNQIGNNLSNLNINFLSQTKQISEDHNKNNIIHSEINSKILTLNTDINNLNQSIQNAKIQLPQSQTLTMDDNVKKQIIELLKEIKELRLKVDNLHISKDIDKKCSEEITKDLKELKESISKIVLNKPPDVKIPENIITSIQQIENDNKKLQDQIKTGITTLSSELQDIKLLPDSTKYSVKTVIPNQQTKISVISGQTGKTDYPTFVNVKPVTVKLATDKEIINIEPEIRNISEIIKDDNIQQLQDNLQKLDSQINNLKYDNIDKNYIEKIKKDLEEGKIILENKLLNLKDKKMTLESEFKELTEKRNFNNIMYSIIEEKFKKNKFDQNCKNKFENILKSAQTKGKNILKSAQTKEKNIVKFSNYVDDIWNELEKSDIDCIENYKDILNEYKNSIDKNSDDFQQVEQVIEQNIKNIEDYIETERISKSQASGSSSSSSQNLSGQSPSTAPAPPVAQAAIAVVQPAADAQAADAQAADAPPAPPATIPTTATTADAQGTSTTQPEQNFVESVVKEIENSLSNEDEKYFINKINKILSSSKIGTEPNDCDESKNTIENIKNICITNIKQGSKIYIDIINNIINSINNSINNITEISIKNKLNIIVNKLIIINKNLTKNQEEYNISIKPVELVLNNDDLNYINSYINNHDRNINYNTNQTFKNIIKYILTGIFVDNSTKNQFDELKEDLNTKFTSIMNVNILNDYISLESIINTFYIDLIKLLDNEQEQEKYKNLYDYLNTNKDKIENRIYTIATLLNDYINNNKNSIKNFINDIESYDINKLSNIDDAIGSSENFTETYNSLSEDDKKKYMEEILINKVKFF